MPSSVHARLRRRHRPQPQRRRGTVRTLFDDAIAGRLPSPAGSARAFRRSHPDVVGAAGLVRILRAERARGQASGRPAVKVATVSDLVRASRRR